MTELKFRKCSNGKKIQKKPCMFNYSQKCIVSWTSVLNILGLVFNFKSICIGFKNIFLTKFVANLISNFNSFWSKGALHSNTILKYFISTLCTAQSSTEWVFICSCSPIFCWAIKIFLYFFLIGEKNRSIRRMNMHENCEIFL